MADAQKDFQEQVIPMWEMTSALRMHLLDVLSDADLAYRLPQNASLGQLCLEIGRWQIAYEDSFKTFKLPPTPPPVDPRLANNVASLRDWYTRLDADMKQTLLALDADTIENRTIDSWMDMSVSAQLHTYREAILIFCGKASIYVAALGKTPSEQWQNWIG